MFVICCTTLTAPAAGQPLRQVIGGDDLRASGAVRLADILYLIDGWTVASMDDFRQVAYPLGTPPWQATGWELWVDGHRIDVDVLDTRTLDRLPLALQDVAFVEVSRGPGVDIGPPAARGRLHVHTRRPQERIRARAHYWTGNETGDEGPFRYVEEEGHNVDHLGPDVELTAEYRPSGGWVRASAVRRFHFATYRAMLDRIRVQIEDFPKSELYGASARGHVTTRAGEHDAWAGASRLNDFVFLEPSLREVPVNAVFAYGGARGTMRLWEGMDVRYRASVARNEWSDQPTRRAFDPSLRVDTYRGTAEVARSTAGRAGVEMVHRVAGAATPLTDATHTTAGAYVHAPPIQIRSVRMEASGHVRTDGDATALQGYASVTHGTQWPVTLLVSYVERLFADDHLRWLWTRRGYTLFEQLEAPVAFQAPFEKSRTWNLGAAVRGAVDSTWHIDAGAFVRGYGGLAIERRTLTGYDTMGRFFEGSTHLGRGLGGVVAGARTSVRGRWTPHIRQQFTIGVQRDLAGDAAFRDAWDAQPIVHASTRLFVTPVPTLTFHAAARYRSRTQWPGLDEAASLSDGAYRDAVSASWVVDAAVTKGLWDGRIHGSIIVRNVLDRPYRHHPLGAAFPLSLRVQLQASL